MPHPTNAQPGETASGSLSFDRAADYYDQTRGFPPGEEVAVAALLAKTAGLNAGSRVLEIGVGTGRIAVPLAPHVGFYCGLDLSRPMMARIPGKPGGAAIALAEGDATRLPYPDAHFDAVIAVHVFHLISGWRAALAEVARVLKPGAPLVHCWSDYDEAQPNPVLDAYLEHVRDAVPPLGVGYEQRKTFLEDSGWQRVTDQRRHTYRITNTVRDVMQRIEGRTWSSSWRTPEDRIEAGIKAARAVIAERKLDLDAPRFLDNHFVIDVFRPGAQPG